MSPEKTAKQIQINWLNNTEFPDHTCIEYYLVKSVN